MGNKLPQILSQELGYNPEGKSAFEKEAKRQLRRLAKSMGLEKGTYGIRFNAGGIAVSGEATLHADHIYVQVSQSPSLGPSVLFRTCDSRRDYCGHTNHFTEADAFNDESIDNFASELNRLMTSKARQSA